MPLIPVAAVGCVWSGLGDFDVAECDPSTVTLAADACNRLNEEPNACELYQCAASRMCVLSPRDFDRDGQVDRACGGSDCDDRRVDIGSGAVERCDGVDNDCNGQIDEDLLVTSSDMDIRLPSESVDFAWTGSSFADLLGAAIAPSSGCVLAYRFPDGVISPPCTFPALAATQGPREPAVAAMGFVLGTAFVDARACQAGTVVYQNTSGGVASVPCPSLRAGARLPSVASFPGGLPGVISFYDAPFSDRPTSCGDPARWATIVQWIASPNGQNPSLESRDAPRAVLAERSIVQARPALLSSSAATGILAAASSDERLDVWRLKASGAYFRVLELEAGDGARMTALASDESLAAMHLAVAAVVGCPPDQRLLFTVVEVDPQTSAVVQQPAVHLERLEDEAATSLAANWNELRREWWIGWTTASRFRVRRFDAAGVRIGVRDIAVAETVVAPAVSRSGAVAFVDAASALARVSDIACGQTN